MSGSVKKSIFVAIVAVMIAVGLLAIINMQKNPSGEREMTMNDENLQLSKECSRLLDASIKSNVQIVLDMGEDFCPTLYVTEGERGTFYNLAGFDSIEELRAKSKEALANMPSVKAYLLAYAPSCEIDGARKVLLVMETADRSDANATVVAVACDVDKKKADDGLKLLPQTSSLFK